MNILLKKRVLFIEASMTSKTPRGSVSTQALYYFYQQYKISHPQDELIWLNLNKTDIAQKTLTSENFANFFSEGDEYINQLKQVDKVVLASPMTNFNYPTVLKNYFDHILIAKKTFLYKYDGKGTSEGLLKQLKVQIITTQGAHLGWYLFANHTKTLEGTWRFMGCEVVNSIVIAGTKAPDNFQKNADQIVSEYKSVIKQHAFAF